ncbi:MAG: hypothetical protein DRN07_02375 [Thermoplasmata archaeon]|nr:MAG: hypothetical protein DRN07_02375 [Thermoplasmata archaeon]
MNGNLTGSFIAKRNKEESSSVQKFNLLFCAGVFHDETGKTIIIKEYGHQGRYSRAMEQHIAFTCPSTGE